MKPVGGQLHQGCALSWKNGWTFGPAILRKANPKNPHPIDSLLERGRPAQAMIAETAAEWSWARTARKCLRGYLMMATSVRRGVSARIEDQIPIQKRIEYFQIELPEPLAGLHARIVNGTDSGW